MAVHVSKELNVQQPSGYQWARDRSLRRILDLLRGESIEDGHAHPAEHAIQQCLRDYPESISEWIQDLYNEFGSAEPATASCLLRCLGRLERQSLGSWAWDIAARALASQDLEVRDASVRALESWGDSRALEMLKEYVESESTPWLKHYAIEVISDLEPTNPARAA